MTDRRNNNQNHQYTKSNQTTTQPSRQHTMQPLLLQCCGCCLSPAGAHRSSHPSTTIHCIDSRQYKVDATSNRPTVRSYHKHTQCCHRSPLRRLRLLPHITKPMPGWYSTSSYKLQRTVSSTTTWTT